MRSSRGGHLLSDVLSTLTRVAVHLLMAAMILLAAGVATSAAGRLEQFLPMAQPGEFFEGADRFGARLKATHRSCPSIAVTSSRDTST